MAPWAYSEQLGKNRHGDGIPARSRWYHSMARRAHRLTHEVSVASDGEFVPSLWTTSRTDVSTVTQAPRRRGYLDGHSCETVLWRSPAADRGLSPVVPSRCPQLGVRRRPDTSRAGGAVSVPVATPATGVAGGCVRPPTRCVWEWKRPPVRNPQSGRPQNAATTLLPARYDCPEMGQIRRDEECGRSRRQTGATLGATRLEHAPAALGLHPLAKTVLFGAATLIGLKCSFHASLLTSLSRRLEATLLEARGGWCGSQRTRKHPRCDSPF